MFRPVQPYKNFPVVLVLDKLDAAQWAAVDADARVVEAERELERSRGMKRAYAMSYPSDRNLRVIAGRTLDRAVRAFNLAVHESNQAWRRVDELVAEVERLRGNDSAFPLGVPA